MDEKPTVSTADIVRHFWERRYLLLLAPPVFVVLAYLYTVNFMGEQFESSATLLLRNAPSMLREGPRFDKIEPPSIPEMLNSDEILREVVTAARQRFPDYPRGRFEELRRHFSVRTIITRDTTVQATYSPAVILTARGGSPEIALFLVDEWMRLAIERFGHLRAREAKALLEAARGQFDVITEDAAQLASRQTELEIRRDELDALYASRQALLSGRNVASGDTAGLLDPMAGGLFSEKVRLELELATLTPESTRLGTTEQRLRRVVELIQQTNAEIELVNSERNDVRRELETVRRDLLVAREKAGQLRQIMTASIADSTLVPDPLNPGVAGDLAILSRPVKPETRIAPKRSIIAIGAGVFLTSLLLALVLLELFVRRTVLED